MNAKRGLRGMLLALLTVLSAFSTLPSADAQYGAIVWIRQFGTDGGDEGWGIALDATGVYVAGWTFSTFPGQTNAGAEDAFVRKYDASGTVLWTRQFGTFNQDYALSVAVNQSGAGVYVGGHTWATLPGQTSAGGLDAFVRMYDRDGNELWTRQFGTSGAEAAGAVAADASGVYVAGSTDGTFPGQTYYGDFDAFIRKYDADGNELWTRQYGTVGDDRAHGITADPFGVVVAGMTSGTLPGQTSAGDVDAYVQKYDADGSLIWTRQFGTPGQEDSSGIGHDQTGLYVAGQTTGVFPGQTSSGNSDAFVRKYDVNGNELWTRQFGTSSFDYLRRGLAVNASGIYPAGFTYGVFLGEVGSGDLDAFVRKYDAGGNSSWTVQFGSSMADWTYGAAADQTAVYLTGFTEGVLPGQPNPPWSDVFLVKVEERNNQAPTVTLTRPDGVAANRWSGGTSQLISWNMTDPDHPDAQLVAFVNYSYAGGGAGGAIAGPLYGAESVVWSVPPLDATDVWIHVEVLDPEGAKATHDALLPVVDSSQPVLESTFPADGAVGVDRTANILLLFSEAMNTIATRNAITIAPGPVTTTDTWDPQERALTLDPDTSLQDWTSYTVTVDCGATDASDPGNPLVACPQVVTFTTGGDLPPSTNLTSPDGGEVWSGGTTKDIAWTMSDPDTPGNLSVDILYSTDGGVTYSNPIATGLSLGQGPNVWPWAVPGIDSSAVRVRVCASDGVLSSCDGSAANLTIDSTRPAIVSQTPAPDETNVLPNATIVITFTESMSRVRTEAAVTITPDVGGKVFSWTQTVAPDDTLVISHDRFPACLYYTVTVETGAVDVSDPGNAMAAQRSWGFQSSCAPQLALLVPIGGEVWTGGSTHGIYFAAGDPDTMWLNFTIDWTGDGGATWDSVANFTLGGPPYVYLWSVPAVDVPVAQVRVCVSDDIHPPVCDESPDFVIDSTRPVLLSTNPPDGVNGVDVSSSIILTFSEPMNRPATEGAVSFSPPLVGGATYSWTASPEELTIDPTAAMQPSTLYTVTVGCAGEDASDPGNALTSCPRTFSFTTSTAPTPPVVDLTTPNGGELWTGNTVHDIAWTMTSDGPGNMAVWLNYSTDGGATYPNPIAFLASRPQGSDTYPWTTPCIDSTQVRVRVAASNGMGTGTDASSANLAIDCTRPTVTKVVPGDGAIEVALPTSINVTFSEPMETIVSQNAVTTSPLLSGLGFGWSAGNTVLTITHNDFSMCMDYTVTVGTTAEDVSDPGNTLSPAYSWTVSTVCGPTVAISAPAGGEVWSGNTPHDVVATVTDTDVQLQVTVQVSTDGGATWSTLDGPTVRTAGVPLTIPVTTPPVAATAAYILVIARDQSGINGTATSQSFTIDADAPYVTSSDPIEGAMGVNLTAPFAITFSEGMDRASTEAATSLSPGTWTLAFTWSGDGRTATLDHGALQPGTTYSLTVSAGAHDASIPGNPLVDAYSAVFTIAPGDTTPPTITHTPPVAVYVDEAIVLTATVTDADSGVTEVRLVYTPVGGAEQNLTMTRSGDTYGFTVPAQATPGAVRYRIYAVDADGNAVLTDEYTVSVRGRSSTPSADYLPWILTLVVVLAVVVIALLLFLRRRRRRGKSGKEPPTEPPST